MNNQDKKMNIAIGADHGGFRLKQHLIGFLEKLGYQVHDVGTFSEQSVDYPDFAIKVAQAVATGKVPVGIMIDGAGIGSSMAANKVKGVRAACCNDLYTAHNAREHNNANMLVMGSMVIGSGVAEKITATFLKTPFAGGRHERRVKKIDALDQGKGGIAQSSSPAIDDIIARIVTRFLNKGGEVPEQAPMTVEPGSSSSASKDEVSFTDHLLTEEGVRGLLDSHVRTLRVTRRTIITPLAADLLRERHIAILRNEVD